MRRWHKINQNTENAANGGTTGSRTERKKHFKKRETESKDIPISLLGPLLCSKGLTVHANIQVWLVTLQLQS